jgi:hypothetical protein
MRATSTPPAANRLAFVFIDALLSKKGAELRT